MEDYKSEIGRLVFWLGTTNACSPPDASGKTKQTLAQILRDKDQGESLVDLLRKMGYAEDASLVSQLLEQTRSYSPIQLDIVEFRALSSWIVGGPDKAELHVNVGLETKQFLVAWMSNLSDRRFNWRIDAAATVHSAAVGGYSTHSQD